MLDYLQKLLDSGDTILVDLTLRGGGHYRQRGIYSIDAVGIVIDTQNPVFDGSAIALPWSSIGDMKIHVS